MYSLTTAARSHGKARLGRDYRCLKSRHLSRTAHGNFPAKKDTFWQDDEIVKIIDGRKVFDSWTPTKCPDCKEPIIFDAHRWPHCPDCGLIFPNDLLYHADNQLSYAIRKAKERDRKLKERRLEQMVNGCYIEDEPCNKPHVDHTPILLGKIPDRHKYYSEQMPSEDRQRAIDRMTFGLKLI